MTEKQTSKQAKKLSVKSILPHLLTAITIAFLVLYKVFEWDLQAQMISKYLHAIICAICYVILALEVSRILKFLSRSVSDKDARKKTAMELVFSILNCAVYVVLIVLVLTLFIEDTSSLFTGLGLLGMVVGLGCNKLIADIVAGIFIVIDGTYQVGDRVEINGVTGKIKEVGIRNTIVEDMNRNLRYFNNSAISGVCNHSQSNSLVCVLPCAAYGSDLDYVEKVLNRELPKIKDEDPRILAGPIYKGVQGFTEYGMQLRIVVYTAEDNRYKVERAMNKRMMDIFAENDIKFGMPGIQVFKGD